MIEFQLEYPSDMQSLSLPERKVLKCQIGLHDRGGHSHVNYCGQCNSHGRVRIMAR
ncbi:hypothetical protein LINPERPRIM_LOCUS33462 [Linum perenne]